MGIIAEKLKKSLDSDILYYRYNVFIQLPNLLPLKKYQLILRNFIWANFTKLYLLNFMLV